MIVIQQKNADVLGEQPGREEKFESRQILKSAVSLYSFAPSKIIHPSTEEEIVQIVRVAAQQNLKVRAIGALHSAAPIPATEGICLVLNRYKTVLRIEGTQVTVQAGIKLWELNEILAQKGLALPVLGTIVQQTASGAISTGTHGGSLHRKSLSSYVQALRLIRADGEVIDVDRSQENFNAFGLSMGLLGLVSTVTFQCIPAFSLQTQLESIPFDRFVQRFDEIQQNNQYVDMRYSPITDTVQTACINPTETLIQEMGGWRPTKRSRFTRRWTDWVNKSAQRLFSAYRLNWLQRLCIQSYDKTVYVRPYGPSHFVLTHFDATSTDLTASEKLEDLEPVGDMEMAIPYHLACEALLRIRSHFQDNQRYPCMHIHMRCSAAEEFWLSPAYHQPICWLEFWEYPHTGQFFGEIIEILQQFNIRGHWGKQIPLHPDYLKSQYEKWPDFIRIYQRLSPNNMFSNPYLEQFFG